ncbi:MAG TPA: glycosyltransferase family 2 protein [Vicinamibacterales bacterium]|nr:glycosyltransferase family 2 protein [Vicinamibacterales bacterium]
MSLDLAIIIVSYNARNDLERTLRSLAAAPPATSHRVVVVDNASSDGSAAMVREGFPAVQVIDAGENLGFARANNVGIRATDSDLVLLLNSDTVAPPGAIDALVADLLAHPEAAAAGPTLVDGAGRRELSFGRMMTPWTELCQKSVGALYDAGFPPAVRAIERRLDAPRTVDWVSGACLLVHRTDAEAAGLLDERFFLYTEDVDFCASLRALGRLVRYTPAARIVHLRGRSRAYDPRGASAMYRRSHLAFYEKHHPGWHKALRWYLRMKGQLPHDGGRPAAGGRQ